MVGQLRVCLTQVVQGFREVGITVFRQLIRRDLRGAGDRVTHFLNGRTNDDPHG